MVGERKVTKGGAFLFASLVFVFSIFLVFAIIQPTVAQPKSGEGSMPGMMGSGMKGEGRMMEFPDTITGDLMALIHSAHGGGMGLMMGMMMEMMASMDIGKMMEMHSAGGRMGSGGMGGGDAADHASHHPDGAESGGTKSGDMMGTGMMDRSMMGESGQMGALCFGDLEELVEKYPAKAKEIRKYLQEARKLIEELQQKEK